MVSNSGGERQGPREYQSNSEKPLSGLRGKLRVMFVIWRGCDFNRSLMFAFSSRNWRLKEMDKLISGLKGCQSPAEFVAVKALKC